MADDAVARIKERLAIEDVVSQYVKLTKAGMSYKARCPFHSEKTPSFIVSPDRGTYHCFGCGAGGDIFTFVQEIEGVDFKGALKMLADRAGVPLDEWRPESGTHKDEKDRLFEVMESAAEFFEASLTESHPARTYLHERGLIDATIKNFRIGWAPDEWHALSTHLKRGGFSERELLSAGLTKEGDKGNYDRFRSRIMFPINDTAGRVVAFSGRIFGEDTTKDDVAKYMNSPETPLFHKSRILYGFDRAKQAIRKHQFAILVEGQMDLVAVHQAGWPNAVAVSGTALTEEHLALIRRFVENLLLALDSDSAGIAAARKSARLALRAGMDVKVARLTGGKDPADIIVHDGKEAWAEAVRKAQHIVDFLLVVYGEETKDSRAYIKRVEKEVLPFVADIKSPLDREHFIRRIAERLGVSEESVRDGVRAASRSGSEPPTPKNDSETVVAGTVPPRIVKAYRILAWQESVDVPAVDINEMYEKLERAIGNSAFRTAIPAHELDAARLIEGEGFENARHVAESLELLLRTIERERLQGEYKTAREALFAAEQSGEEARIQELLELCTGLSSAIAKLS